MHDKELVFSILNQIFNALETIKIRSLNITNVSFFTDSNEGAEKLDAICMLFIAIGESIKNLDKITNCELLARYPEIDWKGIKGFRDVIAHHYFDIDAEQIFWICKSQLPTAKTVSL